MASSGVNFPSVNTKEQFKEACLTTVNTRPYHCNRLGIQPGKYGDVLRSDPKHRYPLFEAFEDGTIVIGSDTTIRDVVAFLLYAESGNPEKPPPEIDYLRAYIGHKSIRDERVNVVKKCMQAAKRAKTAYSGPDIEDAIDIKKDLDLKHAESAPSRKRAPKSGLSWLSKAKPRKPAAEKKTKKKGAPAVPLKFSPKFELQKPDEDPEILLIDSIVRDDDREYNDRDDEWV